LKQKLNPFNLCPQSTVFWFHVPPYRAIGIGILGLKEIAIYIRQQVEPNETMFLMFKIIDFRCPAPLTLMTLFSSLALVIIDGALRLIETIRSQYENDPNEAEILFYSFNLTPRMSIFFPVYDNHTAIGFLTIDFRHLLFSVKQSIEPNGNISSIIRFLDLYAPFPLQIGVMSLAMGLFINGLIYKNNN
jgi:hypothetical protein